MCRLLGLTDSSQLGFTSLIDPVRLPVSPTPPVMPGEESVMKSNTELFFFFSSCTASVLRLSLGDLLSICVGVDLPLDDGVLLSPTECLLSDTSVTASSSLVILEMFLSLEERSDGDFLFSLNTGDFLPTVEGLLRSSAFTLNKQI